MNGSDMKKIGKAAGKIVIAFFAALGAGETAHKCRDARTRKKAMDAAVRENNKKTKVSEKEGS